MMYDILTYVVSSVFAIAGISISNKMHRECRVMESLDYNKLVNERYLTEEVEIKRAIRESARKVRDIVNREKNEVSTLLSEDPSYIHDKATMEATGEKIKSLKKSIDNFKADTTQVAVGSGDSAVAVKVSNSSAKSQLEADLASANSEYKQAVARINSTENRIKSSVISKRSKDDQKIFSEHNSNNRSLSDLIKEKNEYEAELRNDPEISKKISRKAIAESFNKKDIILSAVFKSIIPCVILYKIWNKAYKDLMLLKEVATL